MIRTPVCHYYQAGCCRNGDKCTFIHPKVRCRTFCSTGWCPYGYNCHFWHDPSEKPLNVSLARKPCQFFANNQCKYGDRCSFSHDLSSDVNKGMTLMEYRNAQKTTPSTSVGSITSAFKNSSSANKLCTNHTPPNVSCSTLDISESQDTVMRSKSLNLLDCRERLQNLSIYPATHVLQLDSANENEIQKLRDLEIKRLFRSYSSEKLRETESFSENRIFHLKFSSSDPDWIYDVREVILNIVLSRMYPKEALHMTVLPKEPLPMILVEHLNQSIASWIDSKHKHFNQINRIELYLRPLLIWLDRSLESLFTEGLRKYKHFLQNNGSVELNTSVENEEEADDIHVLEANGTDNEDICPDTSSCGESEENDVSEDSHETSDSSTMEPEVQNKLDELISPDELSTKTQLTSSDSYPASQKLFLENFRLLGKAGTFIYRRLAVSLHCTRCRLPLQWSFSLHGVSTQSKLSSGSTEPRLLRSLPPYSTHCARCNQLLNLVFQGSIVHAFDNQAGTLYLNGCVIDDVMSKQSDGVIFCTGCNGSIRFHKLGLSHPFTRRCYNCHALVGLQYNNIILKQVEGPSLISALNKKVNDLSTPTTTASLPRKLQKHVNSAQAPVIQDGAPLPAYGTCQHYRKSYRWLRFPCCDRLEPCDVCHDKSAVDGHEMEIATRMTCGFCSKEQPFSLTKPCIRCGKYLCGSHSAHWEGGKGCRNKLTMSRKDTKKYSNLSKTISKNKKK